MKCFQPNKVPIKEPLKDSVSPLGAFYSFHTIEPYQSYRTNLYNKEKLRS
jgi:hypothetical protein